MKTEISLEDEVRCKYTGVEGIVLNKTEFVNGCIQFGVTLKYDKEKPITEAMAEINIDSQSLIIIKKGPRHKKEKKEKFTGGPSRIMRRRM